MRTTARIFKDSLASALPAAVRTLREFAEEEIFIPNGPYEGAPYAIERQPVMRHYFDAVEHGYSRVFATGPTQSGKTLSCSVIPLLYHLFELRETVVFGLPNMDMAGDKWREDILPVLKATRYADLLPDEGAGSKGAIRTAIRFQNGATLRFMTAGTGDKGKAGYTTRVVVLTEVDGFDTAGSTSRETDKVGQIEARTLADPEHARVYGECTVSIEQGRTWQEYTRGTCSAVLCHCQACGEYVLPEREHLTGWEEAENEIEAMDNAVLCCPDCGAVWTEDDRRRAVEESLLVHRGQAVVDGKVVGDAPATRTLGFRWNATHNLFVPIREYAARLWRITHRETTDEENAEKEISQFVWAVPYAPPTVELAPLDAKAVNARRSPYTRSVLPEDTTHLAMGVDVGKWRLHWSLVAWRGDKGHVADYGEVSVGADHMDPDLAMLTALRECRDWIERGWQVHASAKRIVPQQVWIDSGYNPQVIYRFCRESSTRYRPTKGHGTAKKPGQAGAYVAPKQLSQAVRKVGEELHVNYLKSERVELVHVNADYWKSWLQRRFNTPTEAPGCMALWESNERNIHMDFAKSLCAEVAVETFVPGKGTTQTWEVRVRNKSHWLDATCLACAALSMCGASLHKRTTGEQLRQVVNMGRKSPIKTMYRRM